MYRKAGVVHTVMEWHHPTAEGLSVIVLYNTEGGLASLVGEQSQAVNIWKEEAAVASFYTLPVFALKAEKGFSSPKPDLYGEDFAIPTGRRH